jgi:hypothetical protein
MAETSRVSRRPVAAAWVLGLVVLVSAALRSIFAWQHTTPRLFPDEYIYAALSRSIGHSHLQIRGGTVHFPGLLEPILAAPIWRLAPLTTAYHLVQVENAVAASLAAIPLYLLARSLHLSHRYSIGVAIYGVLIPEIVLVAFTSSDAVAYPFALTAIALAVRSIDQPTRRHQVGFLIFASLAALTRVQYFVIVPAYLAAALLVDRREAWRKHRIALLAAGPAVGVASIALLGFYTRELKTPLDANYVKWFFLQMFLIAVETGVVMTPGAVAALTKPQGRRELGFASFTAFLALLLLVEATAHAADSAQFKERYLFVIVALVPVAFGLFVRHSRPRRFVVIALSAAIAIAAARLPLSEFATSTFKMDSQFLFAVSYAQDQLGTANSSLAIALVTTLLAAIAALFSYRPQFISPLAIGLSVVLIATAVATHADLLTTNRVRGDLPSDLTWVDHAARGSVSAIETPLADKQDLLYALYWNDSVKRELLLGSAVPTDEFRAPRLTIRADGVIENAGGDILFHNYGTTGWFANASVAARAGDFELLRPHGRPRLRLVIEGRFRDGWLSRAGRLRVWTNSGSGVQATFRLTLPSSWKRKVTVTLAGSPTRIAPGQSVEVTCKRGTSPLDVRFVASQTQIEPDLRIVSARLERIAVHDEATSGPTTPSRCSTHAD